MTKRISIHTPRSKPGAWRAKWLSGSLLLVLGGCSCFPPAAFTGCVDFESVPLGTRYVFQDTLSDSGVDITVEAFQWANGTWTNGNYAQSDNRGRAGGSGQDMQTNNVNLRFDLPAPAVAGLSMAFGEYGGNINLQVNGEFRNFGNFASLNGDTVGGAAITVVGGTGNDTGSITLSGQIQSFSVGGQELWIDDLCAL